MPVVVDAAALASSAVAACRRALRDTMEAEQDVSNKLKTLSKKAQRLRGELRDAQRRPGDERSGAPRGG